MTGALVAGLLAGWAVAVPVGPVAVLLVGLAARTSWRTGAGAALGVAAADGLYALLAVLGGAALARAAERSAEPLRWGSVVVLLVLAAHGARAALQARHAPAGGPASAPDLTPRAAALRLLLLTLANPTTVVLFAALVVGAGTGAGWSSAEQVAFAAAATVASASWQLLLAASGALLGGVLTSPRSRCCTGLAASALVAGLALRLTLAP